MNFSVKEYIDETTNWNYQSISTKVITNGIKKEFRLAQEVAEGEIDVYVNGVLKTFGSSNDYLIFKDDRYVIFNSPPAANSTIEVYYSNFDTAFLNPINSGGVLISGVTSGATAIIEKAVKRIITDGTNLGAPIEIFINSKTLVPGAILEYDLIKICSKFPQGPLLYS